MIVFEKEKYFSYIMARGRTELLLNMIRLWLLFTRPTRWAGF